MARYSDFLSFVCNIIFLIAMVIFMAQKSQQRIGANPPLSLHEVAYRELRNAILNGVFSPGQVLRQEEVANRLGVSRSPLREALPRLESEGMVVLNPRRGYSVAKLEAEHIIEAFELRTLLEQELGRHAIRRRTNAEIAEVYSILAAMGTAAELSEEDMNQWFELNAQFHLALFASANRPQYMRALNGTRGAIECYVRAEVRLTGDLTEAQAEHSEIARAFATGDEEGFLSLIREHAFHTKNRLLSGLERQVEA